MTPDFDMPIAEYWHTADGRKWVNAEAVAAERARCAGTVKNRLGLWRGHGGNTKLESPYNHLTLEGELEIIAAAIRTGTP